MSVPSIMIEPLSGLSRPMSVLRNTDLPVPDGPSITQISPAGMVSVTSPQMSCFPNDFVRSSTLISTPTGQPTPLRPLCPASLVPRGGRAQTRTPLTSNNGLAAARLRVGVVAVTPPTPKDADLSLVHAPRPPT